MNTPLLSPNSFDWEQAEYEATASINDFGNDSFEVSVENEIQNSKILNELVASQQAEYAIEIRSPYTIFSSTIKSDSTHQEGQIVTASFKLNKGDCGPTVFIKPILVASESLLLNTKELLKMWRDEKEIEIPKGTILGQADMWQKMVNEEAPGFFEFQIKEGMEDGEVEIQIGDTVNDSSFVAYISEKTMELAKLDHLPQSHNLHISALAGVFQKLSLLMQEEDREDEILSPTKVEQIEQRLQECDSPSIELNHPEFDALAAATAIAPFEISIETGGYEE